MSVLGIGIGIPWSIITGAAAAVKRYFLLESGDNFLLETGDALLLEDN